MEGNKITRTDLLNHLAKTHNLSGYLEIGLQDSTQNFGKIICEDKFCVDIDPLAKADFTGSSDDFFKHNKNKYDLIFLDGLHHAEQVRKDFENALKVISPNGFIVIHDCNPIKEEHTIVPRPTKTGHWNGDVYKFAAALLHNGKYTVDIDNGCMVCPGNRDRYQILHEPNFDWNIFSVHRKSVLNLISWDEFVNSRSHVQ